MFPSSSRGNGGLECSYPTQGVAHPYLDPMPPPPSLSLPSGPPTIFFPYSGTTALDNSDRHRAEDRGDSGAGAIAGRVSDDMRDDNPCFQEEDRMLLRLLYHQQQAIQVQLNTMTEWMQQVNYRIATMERLMRTSRGTLPTSVTSGAGAAGSGGAATSAAAVGLQSYSTQPASRSASAMESGYAPASNSRLNSHPRPATRAEQPSAEVPRAHLTGPGSAYSGKSHLTSSGLAVSSVLESSRACTPPSEQTRHHISAAGGSSAVPSTTRSYDSALAAPWDPHNASQQSLNNTGSAAVHSRTSSHTSALGRRANPLLNSSGVHSKLPVPASAAATWRSSLADSRLQPEQNVAGLGTSNFSGTGQASSASTFEPIAPPPQPPAQPRQPPVVSPPATASLTAADAVVPPYRRVSAESIGTAGLATLTRQPLSRPSVAAARHAPPISTLAGAADSRGGGREGTLPPPSNRTASIGGDSSNVAAVMRSDVHNGPTDVVENSKERKQEAVPSADPPAALPAVHTDPAVGTGEEDILRGRREAVPRRATASAATVDDDDLSDGYGSYESRMYMKKLGLL